MIKITRITVLKNNGDRFTKKMNVDVANMDELESQRMRFISEFDAKRVNMNYSEIEEENKQ